MFAKSLDFFHGIAEQTGLIMTDERRLGQLEALHRVLSTIAHQSTRGPVAYARYADGMVELIDAYADFVKFYGWIIGWCAGGEVRRSELEALERLRDKLNAKS